MTPAMATKLHDLGALVATIEESTDESERALMFDNAAGLLVELASMVIATGDDDLGLMLESMGAQVAGRDGRAERAELDTLADDIADRVVEKSTRRAWATDSARDSIRAATRQLFG